MARPGFGSNAKGNPTRAWEVYVDDPVFDIFRRTSDKDAVWVEEVQGLWQVKKRLLNLKSTVPGSYLVFDATADKFIEPFAECA